MVILLRAGLFFRRGQLEDGEKGLLPGGQRLGAVTLEPMLPLGHSQARVWGAREWLTVLPRY